VEEALAETFPAVAHIAGPRAFSELARRYAPHIPVRSPNLNEIGSRLPRFLRRDALSHRFPFLSDLATLEWCVWRAFHAPRKKPLDPRVLARLEPADHQRAALLFQPSVALVRSAWPIRDLWQARHTPVEEIDIEIRGRPDRVWVYRWDFDVVCESVPEDEAVLLESLLARMPLGRALEAAGQCGLDPVRTAELFARSARMGLFRRLVIAGDDARPATVP